MNMLKHARTVGTAALALVVGQAAMAGQRDEMFRAFINIIGQLG